MKRFVKLPQIAQYIQTLTLDNNWTYLENKCASQEVKDIYSICIDTLSHRLHVSARDNISQIRE